MGDTSSRVGLQKGCVVGEEGAVGVSVHVEAVCKVFGRMPAFKMGGELLCNGASVSVDVVSGRVCE